MGPTCRLWTLRSLTPAGSSVPTPERETGVLPPEQTGFVWVVSKTEGLYDTSVPPTHRCTRTPKSGTGSQRTTRPGTPSTSPSAWVVPEVSRGRHTRGVLQTPRRRPHSPKLVSYRCSHRTRRACPVRPRPPRSTALCGTTRTRRRPTTPGVRVQGRRPVTRRTHDADVRRTRRHLEDVGNWGGR